jgi:hypothetical protein
VLHVEKDTIKIGNRSITNDEFGQMKESREAGEVGTSIANRFNVDSILIYEFFKKYNIKPMKDRETIISGKRFSRNQLMELFDRRKNGESSPKIAQSIDVDERRLVKVFQKYRVGVTDKQFQDIGGKKLSKEKVDGICNRRRHGEKVRDLARELEVQENSLTRFFLRHDIKPAINPDVTIIGGKAFSSEHVRDLIDLRKSGVTYEEIANKISVGIAAIYNFLTIRNPDNQMIGLEESEGNERELKIKRKLDDLYAGSIQKITIGCHDFAKDQVKALIERRERGEKLQPIAKDLGIDRRALQYFLSRMAISPKVKENHVKIGNTSFPRAQIENIKDQRMAGKSIRSISKDVGINNAAIRNYLKKEGVLLPKEISRDINRRYSIDHDFFSNDQVSSTSEAYILGLMITDGSLDPVDKTVELSLMRDDLYLLERIKNILKSDRPIYLPKTESDNRARLRLSSIQVFEDLRRKGIDPSTKSFTARFPNQEILLEHFQRDFIRGVFDGDGWVSINKEKKRYTFGFIGTKDLLEGIQAVLVSKCNLNPVTISPKSKAYASCFTMSYGGKQNLLKFYDLLYGKDFNIDRDLCLRRKWEKMNSGILP